MHLPIISSTIICSNKLKILSSSLSYLYSAVKDSSKFQNSNQAQPQSSKQKLNSKEPDSDPILKAQIKRHSKMTAQIMNDPKLTKQEKKKKYELLGQEFRKRKIQIQKQKQFQIIKQYLKQQSKKDQKFSRKIDDKQKSENRQYVQQTTKQSYIPNNLIMKKLSFQSKKILLLGIQEQSQTHALYIKTLIERLPCKHVLTSLPPDLPYFIKTEQSFVNQWKKFIKDPQYAKEHAKFYLNPSPNRIEDIWLGAKEIQLVRAAMGKSKQFGEFYGTIMVQNSDGHMRVNGLLQALVAGGVEAVGFCDYPILKERQLWAMSIPLQQLRNLFKTYHFQVYNKQKQSMFDPRILFPKPVIAKKFSYMSNILKYSTYIHQSQTPYAFICPAEYCEMFVQQFAKPDPVVPFSQLSTALPNLYGSKSQEKPLVPFIQFVEKLVIMDIILEPIIQKYFIKYLSFPYTARQTLGGSENIGRIFIVWKHFWNMYTEAISKAPN